MKPILFNDNVAEENSYLLSYKSEALVIDPGFNGEAIMTYLKEKQLTLSKILLTHGHYDHIRDIRLLAASYKFTLYIHLSDYPHLFDESLSYARQFNGSFKLKADQEVVKLADGDTIAFGLDILTILHTPGHTIGSACFMMNKCAFTGDTLFAGEVGRTDLATGSEKMMSASLKKLIAKLSNEMIIYPGHNEASTFQKEKQGNPYLKPHLKSF